MNPLLPLMPERVRGLLLTPDATSSLQERVKGKVWRDNSYLWKASDSAAAAAWLSLLSNQYAGGEKCISGELLPAFETDRPVVYRGQGGRYPTIGPSARHAGRDQAFESNAEGWFREGVSRWANGLLPNAEPGLRLDIEREHMNCALQHYGIATHLVDWTWDPMVAVSFSLDGCVIGESSVVLLRQIYRKSYDVKLPGTFIERCWRQAGLFAEHYGELSNSHPTEVRHYLRIEFPVDEADRDRGKAAHKLLYTDPVGLERLANASKRLAREYGKYQASKREALDPVLAELAEFCQKKCKLIAGRVVWSEDQSLIMDYIDIAALRRRPGQTNFVFDKQVLREILIGLAFDHELAVSRGSAAAGDRRAFAIGDTLALLQKIERELDRAESLQELGILESRGDAYRYLDASVFGPPSDN